MLQPDNTKVFACHTLGDPDPDPDRVRPVRTRADVRNHSCHAYPHVTEGHTSSAHPVSLSF